MLAGFLRFPRLGAEHTLEGVDVYPQLFDVYGLVPSLKLANDLPESREGCAPFPQHEKSLANECSYVKA
jgi:hypothetical protein